MMSSFWEPVIRLRQVVGVTGNTVTGDSSFDPMKSKYDAVILGAGHNGLAAASYLGRAGLS
jgi:ribulose 1,5-bisphosphate synthetase/thiazole synthase